MEKEGESEIPGRGKGRDRQGKMSLIEILGRETGKVGERSKR
jgi:hypothetical protein